MWWKEDLEKVITLFNVSWAKMNHNAGQSITKQNWEVCRQLAFSSYSVVTNYFQVLLAYKN